MMNKKLVAIILALAAGLSVIGVGIFIHFKNKTPIDDLSYSSVELAPEDILFSKSSNKPNIELLLDEELFVKAFGKEATVFDFRKADRIRIHFSNGDKFELEPEEETVKITETDGKTGIKIYIDDKDIFENADKTIKFDTSCSVKIFFDEGSFNVDDEISEAITFVLKCDSKPVSNIQEAYMSVKYENLVLKLEMTDSSGKEILFTTSGNTKDSITVFADKKNKHSFNPKIVTTELFRTAILNPSKSFGQDDTISVCVPDGFFVNSDGNRIKVMGIKDSGKNFRFVREQELTTTTKKTEDTEAVTQEGAPARVTESEGVYAITTFEKEFPLATGEFYRNLTDLEVVIPTNSDWKQPDFSGRILTNERVYDIPSSAVVAMEASTLNGYVAYISIKDAHTSEMGGVEWNGILLEGGGIFDIELEATDSEGNVIANISTPVEY